MNLGDDLPPGTAFGSYEIVRLVGRGAFGSVYEALKMPLRRRVALKVLLSSFVRDQNIVGRFLREAEAAASLRHPNIVETFDVDVVDGLPIIAMEFLEGETLKARLLRTRSLDVTTTADLLVPVLSAVARVHEQGIVHRDLKPENIFLENRLGAVHPKVLDFGIAKADDSRNLSVMGARLGSPLYMSPEQHGGAVVDLRTDLWALGAILFQCLTGQLPFPGSSLPQVYRAVTMDPTPSMRLLVPSIPPALEGAVRKALEKQPEQRWKSARELGAAVLPFASPMVQHAMHQDFSAAAAAVASLFVDDEADGATLVARTSVNAPGTTPGSVPGAYGTPSQNAAFAPSGAFAAPPSGAFAAPPSGSFDPSRGFATGRHATRAPTVPSGSYSAPVPSPSFPTPHAEQTLAVEGPSVRSYTGPHYIGAGIPAPAQRNDEPALDTLPRRSLFPLVMVGVVLLAVIAGGSVVLTRRRSSETATRAPMAAVPVAAATRLLEVVVDPGTAALQLDAFPAVTGQLSRPLADDAAPHTLRVSAPGYAPQTFTFLAATPPPLRVVLAPLPRPLPAIAMPTQAPTAHRPQELAAPASAPTAETPRPAHGHHGGHRPRNTIEVGNL